MGRVALGLFLSFSVWSVAALPASADWPRFRGPNGAGVAPAAAPPVNWTPENTLWRVELPGTGHGSPAVADGRLYVASADAQAANVRLECRDAVTGAELWSVQKQGPPFHLHALNSFASGTPAVGGGVVAFSWADADGFYLAGYSVGGEELWSINLGPYESSHGYARSPILEDGVVYLASNQNSGSFVLAVDAQSGVQRWRRELPPGKASYGTPCVVPTAGGGRALVTGSSELAMDALDLQTGEVVWSAPGVFPERCVNSPLFAEGLVWASSGSGGSGKLLVGVRPPSAPGGEPEVAVRITKGAPYVSSPLLHQGVLLLWHDRGALAAFDPQSGEQLWAERIGGKFFASPVSVGGVVWNVSMDGEAVAVQAGRGGCQVLARHDLGGPSEATPAVAGGRLYLRTDRSLICVGAPATAARLPARR